MKDLQSESPNKVEVRESTEDGSLVNVRSTNRQAFEKYTSDPVLIQNKYPSKGGAFMSSNRVIRQTTDIVSDSSNDEDYDDEESAAHVYQMEPLKESGRVSGRP